jgi:hypothetical protein
MTDTRSTYGSLRIEERSQAARVLHEILEKQAA